VSVIYRVQGSTLAVPLTVTPAATATPTVTLFTDSGHTTPYGGAGRVVTGSGNNWSYPINDLPVGTYYLHEQATTASGTVSSDTDSLVILSGSIGSTGSLATLAELKTELNIDTSITTYDTELQGFLDAATPVVEGITGPILQRQVTSEPHDGGKPVIVPRQQPVLSITSVTEYVGPVAYTLTAAATPAQATGAFAYTADPVTGTITRRAAGEAIPFPGGRDNVLVTYTVGTSTVHPNARLAALMYAAAMWQDTQNGFALTGAAESEDGYEPSALYVVTQRIRSLLDSEAKLSGFA
jgi:hypothetical protein